MLQTIRQLVNFGAKTCSRELTVKNHRVAGKVEGIFTVYLAHAPIVITRKSEIGAIKF